MYSYLKALHVIFIVTWFSGLFYIVRLFVYHREAQDKPEVEKDILTRQYRIMIKRLWLGITWPSAIITVILGLSLLTYYKVFPIWLVIKLFFVGGLLLYHVSLHVIYRQQLQGRFKQSSQQLRIWNEVATIFLVAIVMLVVVREGMSWLWGLAGLFAFVIVLMSAIRIYKRLRTGN